MLRKSLMKFGRCEQALKNVFRNVASQKDTCVDWVGPPDPHSNMRKVVYATPDRKCTGAEVALNALREDTYAWNNEFWSNHNQRFFKEKKEFLDTSQMSYNDISDNLSVFYKHFLEVNKSLYANYNREWYRRNFRLLWLSVYVAVSKIFSQPKKS